MADIMEKYPSLKSFENDNYVEEGDGRETRLLEYIKYNPSCSELHGKPANMLAAMDEYAAKKEFLISVGADKARTLSNLILEEKPCVLVECGGYVGYSAILWADAMRWAVGEDQADDSTQPSVPHVWSLELSPEYAAVAAEMVGMTGLSEFVTIVVGPSEGSLGRLHAEGVWKQGIDVLFLDHVESLYVQDLKVCEGLGLLKAGTLILADNVVRPEAPDYDQYVRAHEGLESHGVKALIMPGEFEYEIEVTRVKE